MPSRFPESPRGATATALVAATCAALLALAPAASATTAATTATGVEASRATPVVALPPGVPTDAALQAALDGVVAAGASGIELRVDDGRRTTRLAAGAARLEPRIPMRPDAKVRVGSVTKTFVATVLLQLAAERRLRLDDSLERWLPGLVPGGDTITLRQLLNHTSGIFNYTDDEAFIRQLMTDPYRPRTPLELIAVATAHPPLFPPGTGWSYSNTGYVVLGLVVERVTHRPLSAVVRQRILRPLHLRDTFLPDRSPAIPGYHAHGYVPPTLSDQFPPPLGGPNRWIDVAHITPTWAGAAGALVSTPDDLRRFYRALLGGRLLPPAQLADMKAMVEVGPGFGYGLGLYTTTTPCGQVWGHDGGVPGYLTLAWHDESGRRGLVLALTTDADETIDTAVSAAIAAATCRMLGVPLPAAPATSSRAAGAGVTGHDRWWAARGKKSAHVDSR
jgi:D-alanyl-D-alanine carboxypeptidase